MIDLQYYSPEELIEDELFYTKKVNVYIKRDDLIHPFISGNKWRKLKYILRQALSENKKHLITFGGAYSNHLLATACAAAKFGFKSTGIIRGEPVQNDTLTLCALFGMKLIFVDRESYRDKVLLYNKGYSNDPKAFFIDEGGSGPEGIKGCAELISELTQPYDHIICASGTGTTAAGILKGISERNLTSKFHSVPVFKDGGFIRQEIEKHFVSPPAFSLHPEYHFGGYAKTNPQLLHFMQAFSSSTGILLDPVYTGKMFFALYDLIEKTHFPKGSKILAIHTGGLLGLLGMTKKIDRAI